MAEITDQLQNPKSLIALRAREQGTGNREQGTGNREQEVVKGFQDLEMS